MEYVLPSRMQRATDLQILSSSGWGEGRLKTMHCHIFLQRDRRILLKWKLGDTYQYFCIKALRKFLIFVEKVVILIFYITHITCMFLLESPKIIVS